MHEFSTQEHSRRPFSLLAPVLAVLLFSSTGHLHAGTPQRDLEFASGLVGLGFPDFAERLVEQVLMRHPNLRSDAQVVIAEIALHRGRLEEAEEILRGLPAGDPQAQSIQILLAGVYYSRGRAEEAKGIYDNFFERHGDRIPEDPRLRDYYRLAAYNYSVMLQDMGRLRDAADVRLRILQTDPDVEMRRRVMSESARLLVMAADGLSGRDRDRALDRAQETAVDLLWGGMDLYFGQAISTSAHVEMMRGDPAAARRVLDDYMDMLRTIDQTLRDEGHPMGLSPMAEARFMLGRIHENDAKAAAGGGKDDEAIQAYARALNEFYNVFVTYGESEYGPQAGVKAREIVGILENDYGRTVDIQIPRTAAIGRQVFRTGDTHFRNRNYELAVEEYLSALGTYPEVAGSGGALANLLQCYAHLDDWLMVRALVHYMGERFPDDENAPLGILASGKVYFDRQDPEKYNYVYEHYLDYFPQHRNAPAILFTLASIARRDDDMERAGRLFKRLLDEHPQDRHAVQAMSQMAWAQYAAQNYEEAIPGFIAYLDTVLPGYDRARAQFSLADSYMRTEQHARAIRAFNELIEWLGPDDSPYHASSQDRTRNRDLYERALFFRALACAVTQQPAASVPRLRAAAIRFFQEFIEEFPHSELAPRAMARLGAVQLELDRYDQAVQTFNDLAERYPDSPQGENALFSLVRAAMQVGMNDIARDALNDMLARAGAFSAPDFSRIGHLMFEAGMHREAILAYEQVLERSEERALLERALHGTGQAAYELKDYALAIRAFEELMERYPRSRFFFESKYVLSQAYIATDQPGKAMDALRDIFQYAVGQERLVAQANLMLGKLQVQHGELLQGLASFQRLALTSDPEDEEIRPMIREALLLAISVGSRSGQYQEVEASSILYEEIFPRGAEIEQVRRARQEARRQAARAQTADVVAQ